MKTFIIFLLFKLITSWDTPPTPEDIARDPKNTIDELSYYKNRPSLLQEDDDRTQLLIKEFGFETSSILKKSQLEDFILRLITLDYSIPSEENDFYKKVIKRFSQNVPDEFPFSDHKKYLDSEEFNEALKMIIIEQYGEETYKEFDNYDVNKENESTGASNSSEVQGNNTNKRALKHDL